MLLFLRGIESNSMPRISEEREQALRRFSSLIDWFPIQANSDRSGTKGYGQ